jgi:hypothetical protein
VSDHGQSRLIGPWSFFFYSLVPLAIWGWKLQLSQAIPTNSLQWPKWSAGSCEARYVHMTGPKIEKLN